MREYNAVTANETLSFLNSFCRVFFLQIIGENLSAFSTDGVNSMCTCALEVASNAYNCMQIITDRNFEH